MEKLRIGLIGCGGIMNHHMNGVLTFDDVEIVAVADPLKERTDAMMKRTGATRAYSGHMELFEHEDKLDAVYICVEPTAHNNIEETAIARGLPFLTEKPMTLDMSQGEAIAKAVEAKGLVTCVGFQDRYLDIVQQAKEELADMQVGMVYGSWIGGVPQVWWWMRKDTCGGQLLEQNIHLVDLLRYFFGEAESVFATCGRGLISKDEFPSTLPAYDTDDFSSAMITFKNGLTANLMSGCFVKGGGNPIRNGLTIIGREKSLEYSLRDSLTVYTSETQKKYKREVDQSLRHDRAFLDAVRAKDPTAVLSPYSDALKTLILSDAANRSMESGTLIKL
ncbi:MAG: Gfo/Idh/MocA family oxidoreductase [Firmicutes bacterium]|nr:Gfo/Idh/MocA family oxidoreductase [Bacillota bacterium]